MDDSKPLQTETEIEKKITDEKKEEEKEEKQGIFFIADYVQDKNDYKPADMKFTEFAPLGEKLKVRGDSGVPVQAKTIGAQAKLRRDYFIHELKLSDELRDRYITDSTTELKQIINAFYSTKEIKQAAKTAKEHLASFNELRERLNSDAFLTEKEKLKSLYRYARSISHDIEIYKECYLSNENIPDKRRDDIQKYLDNYDKLLKYHEHMESGEGNEAENALAGIKESLEGVNEKWLGGESKYLKKAEEKVIELIDYKADTKEKKKDEKFTLKSDIDKSLSDSQLFGIKSADRWLMEIGINSSKRLPFINEFLNLTMRERMFVYYMIEKDKLINVNTVDIALSQTGYIPDVKTISTRMDRWHRLRLWEITSGDGRVAHHWGKLETAFSMVDRVEIKNEIKKYSGLNYIGDEKTLKKEKEKQGLKELIYAYRDMEGVQPELINYLDDILAAEEKRRKDLDETIEALKECEAVIRKFEAGDADENAKAEALQKAKQHLNILSESDADLMDLIDRMGDVAVKNYESLSDAAHSTGHKKTSNAGSKAVFTTTQLTSLCSKLSTIPSIFKDTLGANAIVKEGFSIAGASFGILTGVIGIGQALMGFQKAREALDSGDFLKTDAYGMVAQNGIAFTNSFAVTTSGILSLNHTLDMASKLSGVVDCAGFTAQTLSATTASITAVTGGLGLVSNGIEAVNILKGQSHLNKAMEKVVLGDAFTGVKDHYANNVIKLEERNKRRKVVTTSINAFKNAGSVCVGVNSALIASTGIGAAALPFITAGWAALSVGMTVANKVLDYVMHERTKKSTAEEFMQLDDLSWLELPEGVLEEKKLMKDIKVSLFNHMAAKLKFTTFDSMFKFIIRKYGIFLYNHIFYKDGEEKAGVLTQAEAEKSDMAISCMEIVKSLGLNVEYPCEKNKNTRHPALDRIIGKLGA